MTCRDVMTKDPTTLLPTDTIQTIAQVMAREDVGVVPIVEKRGSMRLVGVVTDRDIVLRHVAEGQDATLETATSVMTKTLVTVAPGDDVQRALDAMMEHQVRRVLVAENGDLVGVIAQADVARLGADARTGEVVEQISKADG